MCLGVGALIALSHARPVGGVQKRLSLTLFELGMQVISRSAVALAVAQECMRVKPMAGVLLRWTTEDVTIGNLAIPKDTKIALCPNKVRFLF